MTPARSSAGDPARTLALLWRHEVPLPVRRGPRPGVDVDAVVDAALALADEQGLDAVTLRAVAERAGVPVMTLYTYVPGKAELLDCMVDRLRALQDADPAGPPGGGGWQARVEALARAERQLHLAHPWLVRVSTTRPVLGPGATAAYERGLRAFEGAGLDDVDRDAALTFVLGFVERCARLYADALDAARDSGEDDAGWWAGVAPDLAEAMGPARFPLAARVGTAAGQAHGAAYSAEHAFGWGLPRVIAGLGKR